MSLRAGLDRGFDGHGLQRQRLGVGRFQRGAARPANQQTGGDGAQVGARFIERFAEIGADQALDVSCARSAASDALPSLRCNTPRSHW